MEPQEQQPQQETAQKIELTEDQQKAYGQIMGFLDRPYDLNRPYEVLKGYSGTGKTTLVTVIQNKLLEKGTKVAMSAPTNKAVKVMREMNTIEDEDLEFATIHSLLGLRERIDNDGNQYFAQDPSKEARIEQFGVLFLDEASMLNDELLDDLRPYMAGARVVMVGDPLQIPPVNYDDSEPMRIEGGAMLKEIKRQAADNPIIQLGYHIRTHVRENFPVDSYKEENEQNGNIRYLYEKRQKEEFYDILEEHFRSEDFELDADHAKVVCWTNAKVRKMNRIIRTMLYGEDTKRLEIGEKLIANEPVIEDDEIIFTTNDEFVVEDFKIEEVVLLRRRLWFYDTTVRYTAPNTGRSKTRTIAILHEESDKDFKEILNELAAHAKKQDLPETRRKAWKFFWECKRTFANVIYNYAITAHKSQGSSYRNVFVMLDDINKNKKLLERNRIKYTAITRATETVYLVDH